MKKIVFILSAVLTLHTVLAQPKPDKTVLADKIILTVGQKIFIQNSMSIESSMSPGMDMSSSTITENTLEVKSISDQNYTLSSTLTKMKMSMNMPGNSPSYDSEKKEDQDSEIGKSMGDKLNKPVDLILDRNTGRVTNTQKKTVDKSGNNGENPMQGMMQFMGDAGGDEAIVEGAFELIPQGKNTGDSWSDSSAAINMKVVKTYVLKSVDGNVARILVNMTLDGVTTVEMQGMQMDVSSTTKSSGEIIVDTLTGRVKKKTILSDVQGNMQIMGQSMPISAKVTTTVMYQ